VDAEVLEEEHGTPIVEGGLFKPGMAVEVRRNAGAKAVGEGVGGVEPVEHLVGDLSVARFVGSDEAEAIAAEDRHEAIEQEEEYEAENEGYFEDSRPRGQASAPGRLRIRRRRFQLSVHVQNVSR
jgi:hypothetical protein